MAGETTALQAWLDATRLRLDDLEVRVRALEARTATATPAPSLGLDPLAFGARGDGVADDTAAVQRCVDACPVGGTVDGRGRTYVVRRVSLKSHLTFQDFKLRSPGGTADRVSVVAVGGNYDTTLRQHVVIRDVHVDGNRQAHTNIQQADGERHAFFLCGNVEDVLLERCTGLNAATDGLALYAGMLTRPAGVSPSRSQLRRITVRQCRFAGNRRVGGSADGIADVLFEDCVFEENGFNQGTSLGTPPAGAFDFEGYDVGSHSENVTFRRCKFWRSARPDQNQVNFWPVSQSAAGFVPWTNLRWEDCVFDTGGTRECFVATSGIATKLGPAVMDGLYLKNCTFNGWLILRCVKNVTLEGGSITTSGGDLGVLDHVQNVRVVGVQTAGKRFYADTSTVTYA